MVWLQLLMKVQPTLLPGSVSNAFLELEKIASQDSMTPQAVRLLNPAQRPQATLAKPFELGPESV